MEVWEGEEKEGSLDHSQLSPGHQDSLGSRAGSVSLPGCAPPPQHSSYFIFNVCQIFRSPQHAVSCAGVWESAGRAWEHTLAAGPCPLVGKDEYQGNMTRHSQPDRRLLKERTCEWGKLRLLFQSPYSVMIYYVMCIALIFFFVFSTEI